ncbi:beta-ketoacyl synthase N-terminal-like domain-containing protein [Streptomyces sp. NPDC053367]|uniref:beta-ketoacyl synthase N-terminal-like domain-containing protein n=1 Tax=Streptomyces sp. NPDC053367 TaxID=3365700 RepID=UPI0037D7AAD5
MDSSQVRKLMEEQLKLSRRLQARIRELEAEKHAPLAVVGMGLRLPGGIDTPDGYWDFLCEDRTALTGIPEDRPGLRAVHDPVPGRPGRSYVDRAGFLDDIADFDADFFGISHREAKLLDPQQRMLLETAWEALERAGLAVRRADRLDVGVYLGMMASEYNERLEDRDDMSRIGPYYTTGGGLCFGAGRISFVMGFRGPVVSVDTACSSSLTAFHLAVRALRAGECRYALVCGSNLVLSASLMVSLCQTRALSPDGRSKSFLADADGYGRGEAVGTLALMRLADAEREGRPVLAVVRGSAVNHDGAASGLTAPNGPAQQEVIRAALDDAGVHPADLGWIEAHGTGTVLGDPIEVGALDAVVGPAVRERGIPLQLGSVKSRVGHSEAASGVTALMKTVLMLHHGEIPPAASPDDGALNPHIPWRDLRFEVPRTRQPWPAGLDRRVAGVNSFGMSGTNVHAVLEAYEAQSGDDAPAPARRPELLTLSARSAQALTDLTEAVVARLRRAEPAELTSLCHTLRAGRAPLPHRIAVTGTSTAELADALAARIAGPAPGAPPRAARLVVGEDTDLSPLYAALTEAFPYAFPEPPADPAAGLAALIGGLGPRCTVQREAGTGPARLVFEADGRRRERVLAGDTPDAAATGLLDALAELFEAGAELRLDALRGPGARFLPDLPTYPFQRRRFWVDEPAGALAAVGEAAPDTPAPRSLAHDDLVDYLAETLRFVLDAPDAPDRELSFLEAGGDSFTSTMFIRTVEERFEVGLTAADLPLDLPLTVLFARLAEDIAARADGRVPQEATR